MVAKLLDHNKREPGQQRRRTAKKARVYISKTTTLHVHHAFFAHILAILARLRHETSYFHAPALWSRWTRHKKFVFSFSKLRYGPFEFNPENFANIRQIKWNWIRSMKFKTVRIYFLSEFSVCFHPKILLPWQRDVTTSPLYQEKRLWKSMKYSRTFRKRSPKMQRLSGRLRKVVVYKNRTTGGIFREEV